MTEFTRATAPATSGEQARLDWRAQLQNRVAKCLGQFQDRSLTPQSCYDLEKESKAALDEAGRTLLGEAFNRREPDDKQQAAAKVRYRGATYRINKKTPAAVATSFGPITVRSFLYLHAEDGEPGLHPLHVSLGLVAGTATAWLAERVARWSVDFSQREVRQWLAAEHGLQWSNDRLRRVLREFRRTVVAFRAEAQVQRLRYWLTQAERSRGRHRPVLAVGRDGIMVPLRGQGYQEASTATLSVYDRRGKRLGTVYLGQMPEKYQATLSDDLTAVLKAVLAQGSGPTPRLVYVTDKGQAQEDYYRRVLRRMRDPRRPQQRLRWQWVLDFFHVCGYVSKVREALFGEAGYGWLRRMRQWLRQRRQGVANILRSALQHYQRQSLSRTAQAAFWKAYRYLRRHSRWMDYAGYRRQGLPIGSGVTEAACKTVFTQRLKRSGMRWHRESGQVIVDLRVLHLSGIWSVVVRKDLQSRPLPKPVQRVSHQPHATKTIKKAA
jgi:hypothetical protein